MNAKEIVRAVKAAKAKEAFKVSFNAKCEKFGHPFGAQWNAIVRAALVEAVPALNETLPEKLHGNTADSVAGKLDR